MLDDRFKWKVSKLWFMSFTFGSFLCKTSYRYLYCQAREMEKRKEGRPGEARAALRRSVRDNVYDSSLHGIIVFF